MRPQIRRTTLPWPARAGWLLLSLLAAMLPGEGLARERLYAPHLEATTRLGANARSGELDLFLPLFQAERWLLFADLRGLQSRAEGLTAREGNFGLGFRRLIPQAGFLGPTVIGGYGFADIRRSPTGNEFWQATLGAELFTGQLSFRLNGYLPESDSQLVGERTITEVSGGGIDRVFFRGSALQVRSTDPTVTTTELAAFERALPGFDIEVGRSIELSSRHELWAHARFFHFSGRDDFPDVTGPAMRVDYRLNGLLNVEGLRFEVGGEWRTDDARGSTWIASLRLRVPMRWRRVADASSVYASDEDPSISRMTRRMTERVVRDVDVVTQAQDLWAGIDDPQGPEVMRTERTGGQSREEPARDPKTGQRLRFVHIDSRAAAGGNGSAERPFDGSDVRNTVAGADPAAVVYVHGGGPRIASATTIQLQPGQRVVGSGAPLPFESRSGAGVLQSNTAPELHRLGAGTALRMAADSSLTGVVVSGGRDGVLVPTAAHRATLESVTVRSPSRDGIRVSRADDVVLRNVRAEGTGRDGIRFDRSPGGAIRNAVVTAAGRDAFAINRSDGTSFRGILADAPAREALRVSLSTGVEIRGATLLAPGRHGAIVSRSDGIRIESLRIENAARDGARISRSTGSALDDIQILGSATDGLRIDRSDGVALGNAGIHGAGRDALRVSRSPGAVLDAVSVSNAGRDGLRLQDSDGSRVSGITVTDAARQGLLIVRSDDVTLRDVGVARVGSRGLLVNRSNDLSADNIHIDSVEDGVFVVHSDRLRLDRVGVGAASDDGLDFQGTNPDVSGSANRVDGPVGGVACETSGAVLPGFALGFADATVCP